jgi:hypothetical protein
MTALNWPGLAIGAASLLAITACGQAGASGGGRATPGSAAYGRTAYGRTAAGPAAAGRTGTAGPPAEQTAIAQLPGDPAADPGLSYAPYFETWLPGTIPAAAAASGARSLTLAFLQTARAGSCTLTWDGTASLPVSDGHYAGQIAALRQRGGSVIPSFGGAVADGDGTEIADSCTSVPAIAAAYESVVTTYHVTALDMDVESTALTDRAGITRRSEAIETLQQWAARTRHRVSVYFTMPVLPTGLTASDLTVLESAQAHGVRIAAVNIMAFDYFLNARPQHMGAAAISALHAAHEQLARIFRRLSSVQVWRLEAVTLLPGIDDDAARTEVTSLANVAGVLAYSRAHPFSRISIWALQRDNGGCRGTPDSNTCSGVTQLRWAFSRLVEGFAR